MMWGGYMQREIQNRYTNQKMCMGETTITDLKDIECEKVESSTVSGWGNMVGSIVVGQFLNYKIIPHNMGSFACSKM